MNRYEQHLKMAQVQRTQSGRLRVGMRVYLKSRMWYAILAESEGRFWGTATSPFPGWYWDVDGAFYSTRGRDPAYDINWARTEAGE